MVKLSSAIKSALGGKTGRLERRWAFEASGPILSSPITGKDAQGREIIVFGTKDGKVYMIHDDAKMKWTYEVQENVSEVQKLFLDEETSRSIGGAPVLVDPAHKTTERVIFGSDTGKVYALNDDGKLLWDFKTNGAVRASPTLADLNDDGMPEVVFGSTDSTLYVLDIHGKLLWKFDASSGIEAPATVVKDRQATLIVFGTNDGVIYAIDEKGKLHWKYSTKAQITAKPVAGDIYGDGTMRIIVGSMDNNLYVLDIAGHLDWAYKTEGSICSAAFLYDLNKDKKLEILFGSCDDHIYVLSANGSKLWSYETDFWVVSTPFVADIDHDGRLEVIAGSYDHSLYVFDAEGSFLLNYVPGVSGVTSQTGHYSESITSEPGSYFGKKLWQHNVDGMVVGSKCIHYDTGKKHIIVGTKKGKLSALFHNKG